MAYYRLYVRRGSAGGRFVKVHDFDAPDDATAIAVAAEQGEDHAELWQQARLIATFPATLKEA